MSFPAEIDDRPLPQVRERFERMYKAIRDRICLLEYEPGARLSEEELAREFGVSRTPLRRVLSRLESEGLLESRHGVGTFVTDVDIDALLPVYRLAHGTRRTHRQARSPAPLRRRHRTRQGLARPLR